VTLNPNPIPNPNPNSSLGPEDDEIDPRDVTRFRAPHEDNLGEVDEEEPEHQEVPQLGQLRAILGLFSGYFRAM
jgi:hypothetical protein